MTMQRTSTCLWFDDQALEAAELYVSLIPNSRITGTTRYGEGLPRPAGSVMTVTFELDGTEYTGLNGGPMFNFTPAMSIIVKCDSQEEVDRLWEALTEGGAESQCGWLTDRFGVSWQIIPRTLFSLMNSEDRAAAQRAVAAMLGMKKLDIAGMERAFRGE